MNKSKFAFAFIVAPVVLLAQHVAAAGWTETAVVTRVRTYAGSDRVDIWFNVPVTSGCTNNDRVSIDSTYVTTAERRDRIRDLALAAKLSGQLVELNTVAGCVNNNAKLDYLSLKGL
jgi:hypothetical protein